MTIELPEGIPQPAGEKGKLLLQTILLYFGEQGRWPSSRRVNRLLKRSDTTLRDAVSEIPAGLIRDLDRSSEIHLSITDELRLTFAGVANCSNIKRILNLFFGMIRSAARKEKEESRWTSQRVTFHPSLSDCDCKEAQSLRFRSLIDFVALIAAGEPWCVKSNSSSGWEDVQIPAAVVVDSRIRLFSNVHTLDEYWSARQTLISEPENVYRRRTLDDMHPDVTSVSGSLWLDGHYTQAVLSTFRHIESQVQELFGDHAESGQSLMAKAFSGQSGSLNVRRSPGMSGESEQGGFKFLFMGAMAGLRNPRVHGSPPEESEDEAYEALAFGSLLLRRLDIARERK